MTKRNLKRPNNKPSEKEIVKNAKLSIPTNNEEELTWSNIPLYPLILNYLNKYDIIQLSWVGKSIRSQLEPSLFNQIKLFPDDYLSTPLQFGKKLYKRGIQSIFLDRVIKTLGAKSHLVKEMVIKEDINSKYAKKFFSTFSNIRSLTIDNVDFKIEILVDILKPLGLLENLHLNLRRCMGYSNYTSFISDYRLPKTIQTVKIECHDYRSSHLDSILAIDETHLNLRSYTVASKEMLNQLKKPHPNIIDLIFLNTFVDITNSFEDAIANNPQLKTLTIPGDIMSETMLNSILTHDQISTLKLKHLYSFQQYNYTNLIENRMITTIEFILCCIREFDLRVLNTFKNLQTLKFTDHPPHFESFDWTKYSGNLTQIEMGSYNCHSVDFDKLIECKCLKKIIITKFNKNECNQELMDKLDELKFWQVTKGNQIILKRFT